MKTHDALAKNFVDTALMHWKQTGWSNHIISPEVYLSKAPKSFPSPDALMFDPTNRRAIAFEFKPPTETKRGILTAIGQAVSYLEDAAISYVVSPKSVDGDSNFNSYLQELFQDQLESKLPIGLIGYRDSEARDLEILVDIDPNIDLKQTSKSSRLPNRYWAKHQDMPAHLLWLILDCAYELRQTSENIEDVWRESAQRYLVPEHQINTLNVISSTIEKHDGSLLMPLSKIKTKLQREVDRGAITHDEALSELAKKIDPTAKGDNWYHSHRKNYMTFIQHLELLDDNGHLTEDGLDLHRTGMIHHPTSQTFNDLFARLLLFNGKHLELINDVELFTRDKPFANVLEAKTALKEDYVKRGLFKGNEGKKVNGGTAETFLKYDVIIWGHLGLLKKVNNSQFTPGKGFNFDWKRITQLCTR